MLPYRAWLCTLFVIALGLTGCGSPNVIEGSVPIHSTKVFSKTKVLGKSNPPQKPPA